VTSTPPSPDHHPAPLTFPPRLRVRRKSDFERALRDGTRLVDARLMVWFCPNGLSHARLGLMVGRKHGHAVRRNAIKRRIREAFRLNQHRMPPGFDLVVGPRPGPLANPAAYAESLLKLANRLQPRPRPPADLAG
jgi:ribonuclease P protein component